jgi:hypothetical protein
MEAGATITSLRSGFDLAATSMVAASSPALAEELQHRANLRTLAPR